MSLQVDLKDRKELKEFAFKLWLIGHHVSAFFLLMKLDCWSVSSLWSFEQLLQSFIDFNTNLYTTLLC